MTDYGLSSQQLDVIDALSSGVNMTTAAEQAGVHRNTIANWRRNLLTFQYALAHAQYDRALLYREKAEELADLAVQTIHQILVDPNASASVRLKAALAILQTVSTPPAPKKQIELDIEKITLQPAPPVHNNAQPNPQAHAESVHNSAQRTPEIGVNQRSSAASTSKIVHNPAQSTHPTAARKPGRNEPCPCGSGQKYKRCCLNKPRLANAA